MDHRVVRFKQFFETISRASIARLPQLYADDAWFKDPFNDVRGVAAIGRVFAHMFEQVQAPRFVIHDCAAAQDTAFLTWDFCFRQARLGPVEQTIRGATWLRFDAEGRVTVHRDYWDAAEELYAKLPIIGSMMRWLQRRARA